MKRLLPLILALACVLSLSACGGAPELAVGDAVRVVFDGLIMESYPIQLGTIFAIYRLDENGGVIADE